MIAPADSASAQPAARRPAELAGQPAPRVDAPAKVTGRARYSGEHRPENLAYAATADAAIPAGTVRHIDTADAERAPGVLLVLTHRNADRLPYRDVEPRPAVEPASGRQLRVLQDSSVLFSGQPLAAVVADTQAHAEYAAGLIQFQYNPDPRPVTRFAPEHAQPASQAAAERGRGPRTEVGDPDAALVAATATVDSAYVLPREHHNPIELFAAVAEWEGSSLTLWSKTQWVGNERDTIAAIFGIPAGDVRVISPYVGGAFGAGLRTWPHVTLAAMAARRAGRPVRLELTRRQMYTSTGFRPHTIQRVALGADQRGRLQAHVQDAVGQTSTYEEFAEATLDAAQKTYASASRRTTYQLTRMHTNTPGPMRGPGHATGLVAQEIAMDELAVVLGVDPIELRLRNFAKRDTAKNLPWTSNRLRECYLVGAERFGWARRPLPPRSMSAGGELTGLGMATAMNTSPRYPAQASATIYADGTAAVRSATSDMGPGTYTSMTQLGADALRLPVSQVRFELGDSALPEAQEHGGSTTLASVGSAVRSVCAELRRRLDDLATQHGCDPADTAGILRRARTGQLTAAGGAQPGDEQTTHSAYSFGAVFAEVRVDPDLCEIRVPRMLGVYDIGRVVNPRLARSQVIGGMTGGLGMALLEDTEWDEHHGRVINANLAEYLVPVCADVRDLDVTFLPGHDPVANPLGTKGVAELGLCGVAPAIANAVWHATGIRIREMPVTLDKLLTASHPRPA